MESSKLLLLKHSCSRFQKLRVNLFKLFSYMRCISFIMTIVLQGLQCPGTVILIKRLEVARG